MALGAPSPIVDWEGINLGHVMLGNALIRYPATEEGKLDIGALCEALLFFSQTHLALDKATLALFANHGALPTLIEMLERDFVTASYAPVLYAVFSQSAGGLREHRFSVARFGGNQETGPIERSADALLFDLESHLEKEDARRFHRQLCKHVSFKAWDGTAALNKASDDLADSKFATEIAKFSLARRGVPLEELNGLQLTILPLGDGRFMIHPNQQFNVLLSRVDGLEAGGLFAGLGDARLDIFRAAQRNAAFIGNAANQQIVAGVLSRILAGSPRTLGQEVPRAIYDFISVDTPSVREVINSGQRTAKEFMDLLSRAGSFKKWLNAQNPDKDLIQEMLREKASAGWLEKVPAKVARFGLFSAGGLLADAVAPGASIALGAVDNFLLDRLSKKWRPHFFVENALRGFLDRTP